MLSDPVSVVLFGLCCVLAGGYAAFLFAEMVRRRRLARRVAVRAAVLCPDELPPAPLFDPVREAEAIVRSAGGEG